MNNLSFRISTGLKNIIGRDLISDKFIAVFELVKNSYDAGAHSVVITFQDLNGTNPQIMLSIADRLDILEVILPILISEYNMPSTDELIHFKDYYINKVNMYRNRLGHVKLGEQVLHIQGKDVPIDQALHRMLRKNISEVERTLLSIEKYVVSQM